MTQASVKVLYEIWHNDASMSLGDKNTHNAYIGLFVIYLEARHLGLFLCLKHYEKSQS